AEYEYFVTRPDPVDLNHFFSPVLWGYCVVALVGAAIWRRHPSPGMWSYLGGCGLLAVALFFSSTVAPEWFPLQAPRLLAILIFLLAVPAGCALAAAFRGLAGLLGKGTRDHAENVTSTSPQRRRERGGFAEKREEREEAEERKRREKGAFRQALRASSAFSAPLRWRKLITMGIAIVLLLLAGFTSPGTKIQY